MQEKSTRINWKRVSVKFYFWSRLTLSIEKHKVLLHSGQFDFTDQDVDLKTVDYMKLLDTDKDSHIGFFDFL